MVSFPGTDSPFVARVISQDISNDVALLQLDVPDDRRLTSVDFALQEPGDTRLGMETFTLGYPLSDILGTSLRYSAGSISALAGPHDDASLLQIQNPIQPGNSGGPLFARDGRLAGLVVSKLRYQYLLNKQDALPENLNFAVKIGPLRGLLAERPEGKAVLSRPHGIASGQPEEVVSQLRPLIGWVLVKTTERD